MTVVFLGIGAAKAGTSWVHAQLAGHPECHFRAIKELHYFDALDNNQLDRERLKHQALQDALTARVASVGDRPTDDQATRLTDRADWLEVVASGREDEAAYVRYLEGGAGRARVVGEITPAYALLSQARLEKIARMAADVRMLFLMRDPVERLWSHIRMIAARRDPDGNVTARRCDRLLQRVMTGEELQIVRRSDYAGTLARLAAAVPAGQYLIEVFEDVVSGAGFHRICDFLGISRTTPSPVPVHRGQPMDMTQDQRRAAAAWLAPQYDAALTALGRQPEGWGRKG